MTSIPPSELRTFRLTIEYDGTQFFGWQAQPDLRTVQGTIQQALEPILRQPVKLVGASRTDAGVHALGQVASFEARTRHDAGVFQRALNAVLPRDVGIGDVREVSAGFSARFDAVARRYRYRIAFRKRPLDRDRVWRVPFRPDPAGLRAATSSLLGVHDFSSFCCSDSETRTHVCEVRACTWSRRDEELWFEIEADRFLHSMVRTIVGTAVEVGRGKAPAQQMQEVLEARDRTLAGATAPPQGLYLVSVAYPASVLGSSEQ